MGSLRQRDEVAAKIRASGYIEHPNPEIIEGLKAIALYLGCSVSTARRYINNWGLPATKMPSGRFLITKSLVNDWIVAGHRAYLKTRESEEKLFEEVTSRDGQGIST